MRHEAAYPDRVIEWLFATMMAAWGLYLCVADDTFVNAQYSVLAALAPEAVWGVLSISIAAVRVSALAINGRWRRTPLFRIGCSITGFVWWCSLLFMALSSSSIHLPAGVVWYPVFAIFELVSCWRSAADAFHARSLHFRTRYNAR